MAIEISKAELEAMYRSTPIEVICERLGGITAKRLYTILDRHGIERRHYHTRIEIKVTDTEARA